MFDNHDQQLEHDLQLLKNSIQPSSGLVRRVKSVTHSPSPRYSWYHMQKSLKILLPAAALVVLAIVLVGGKDQGVLPKGTNSGGSQEISSDALINDLVNDALAEQSIANESDADVALIDSDRAAFESFTKAYDDYEY